MSDFNKSDVGLLKVGCRMPDFNKSDVGLLQVGCRMSDFNKSDVGLLQVGCLMSDFNKSDKSDVGCRILTSRMSDGTHKLPYYDLTKSSCDRKVSYLMAESFEEEAFRKHERMFKFIY